MNISFENIPFFLLHVPFVYKLLSSKLIELSLIPYAKDIWTIYVSVITISIFTPYQSVGIVTTN